MGDPYFQELFSDRIGGAQYGKGTEIYKFEKIKRAKRKALEDFPDRSLLDFGIGENDDMADIEVRQQLKLEVDKPENRGYADNGIEEFKVAASSWMKRHLGVELDPAKEINHCIGSKPALAMMPAAFINPGDVTLMTTPGYPVAGTHTAYYGGEVHNLPLTAANDFLPDLDSISPDIRSRAKLLVLNYPNSPTGALATKEFFKKAIEFAHTNKLVVVNDAAHMVLTYESDPLSFLAIDGAKEVGVEIHSLSKGFDMIGWRIGFVAGNPLIVQAFSDIKDNTDSGQFIAIQKAAIAALESDSIPARIREKYNRRLKKLVAVLKGAGFEAEVPGGTYFLYTPSPTAAGNGVKFTSAEEASQFLIKESSICTVPWDNAGAFLRFSVTYQAATEAEEDKLMTELGSRLEAQSFTF
jgi:LL-diaminopimelate aminotransferase